MKFTWSWYGVGMDLIPTFCPIIDARLKRESKLLILCDYPFDVSQENKNAISTLRIGFVFDERHECRLVRFTNG
jgi:hypothetical protein